MKLIQIGNSHQAVQNKKENYQFKRAIADLKQNGIDKMYARAKEERAERIRKEQKQKRINDYIKWVIEDDEAKLF